MKCKSLFFALVLMMALFITGTAMAATVTTLADLQDAINAGGTVTLGANIDAGSSTITVPAGVTVTLDLNGYTISGSTTVNTKSTHLIQINKGNLTIKDSAGGGKLSYEYTGAGDGYKYTHNTVTNNQGILTVEGGTIENLTNVSSQISYAIDTLTNGTIGDATTTITGGTISSPYYIATRVFANSTTHTGTLIISGGEFTGRVQMHDANVKANKGVIKISGGTFNANTNDALYVYANTDSSNLSISVTGGEFNGPIRSVNGAGDVIEGFISGGSFSQDPDPSLIVEGESTVKIDGRWYLGDAIPTPTPVPEVEEEPVPEESAAPTAPPSNPVTGDNSNIVLWMGLMLLAGFGVMLVSKKMGKAQ